MRRRILSIAATVATVIIVASCTDKPAPTAPKSMSPVGRSNISLPGTCATQSALESMVNSVVGSGTPGAKNALDIVKQAATALKLGNIPEAQSQANALIAIILQSMNTLPGKAQALMLVGALQCWTGITTGSLLVMPLDTPKTIISIDGLGGVFIPANSVSEPTLVTVTTVIAPPTPLLITKLDKYPNYVLVSQLSGVTNSLIKPVTVAACPTGVTDPAVRARLRLGHQGAAGFEVTPAADASFLNCAGIASSQSKMPEWVKSLASIILPRPLYAQLAFSGGVGGSASEFSPFGPVDPALSFSGGVGGSASEFNKITTPRDTLKAPTSPSTNKSAAKPSTGAAGGLTPVGPSKLANITIIDCAVGTVNSPVDVACRPFILVTTRNGTVFENVPVTWAVTVGGGQIARQTAGPTCGTFSTTFVGPTSPLFGKSSACWTLGALVGVQTVTATPGVGGDAPAGVSFNPTGTIAFSTTASKGTATITLDSLTQIYDGTARNVKVTTAPAGLTTVNVTYNGLATAPTAAGTYAVVATLDNATYFGTATGTLSVGKASQPALTISGLSNGTYNSTTQLATSAGGGGGAVTFDAGASTACSVSATGLVTITGGTGDCSITATKAADSNFNPAVSAPFAITVTKASASIALSNLSQVFGGDAKSATVTTTPASLATVSVTYNGSPSAPMNAGSYTVVASLINPNYSATNATGSLEITQAQQSALSVTGGNTGAFNSSVTLGTSGGSSTGAVTYAAIGTACSVDAGSGVVSITAGTGTCSVTATKAGDTNYLPVTSSPFAIAITKATATVSVNSASVPFDGTAKSVTASTTPASLVTLSYTYEGSASAPTAVGTYAVVATLANANYQGTGSGTLTITQASQSALSVTASGTGIYGTAVQFGITGGSTAGAVTYNGAGSTACSVDANTGAAQITSGTGACTVTATMAGNANYLPVASSVFSVNASKAPASISISDLSFTFDGSPKSATVSTSPNGAGSLIVTYNGGASLPVNAGSYLVAASLTSANYVAADAAATLVIGQGNQSTLTIGGPGTATFLGASAQLSASGDSGSGGVTYLTTTPALCSVSVTGAVTASAGSGSCVVSVTKSGDANYVATTSAPFTIALLPASQSITFGALAGKTYGDAQFGVTATSSSTLPVSFAASGNCAISGSTVSVTGAGSCIVTATQGGGSNFSVAPPVSQSFSIAKLGAVATAGSATIEFGATPPTIPCAVTGLTIGDVSAVTCASSVPLVTGPGTFPVTPVISPTTPANYNVTPVNGQLTILPYVQSNCFASPITGSAAVALSYPQRRGSSIVVACILKTHSGASVINASGNILVQDRGTTGIASPITAFSANNVFRYASNLTWAYTVNTSTTAFVSGHYYQVTATWNDRSTTTGWFYIR